MIHNTTSYPHEKWIMCSCGWQRRKVAPELHDQLIEAHLRQVGAL